MNPARQGWYCEHFANISLRAQSRLPRKVGLHGHLCQPHTVMCRGPFHAITYWGFLPIWVLYDHVKQYGGSKIFLGFSKSDLIRTRTEFFIRGAFFLCAGCLV
jgi:hypothetical protein